MPIYFHKKDVETVQMWPLGSKMLHQVNASKYDKVKKKKTSENAKREQLKRIKCVNVCME